MIRTEKELIDDHEKICDEAKGYSLPLQRKLGCNPKTTKNMSAMAIIIITAIALAVMIGGFFYFKAQLGI